MDKAYKAIFRLNDEDTHIMEMWEIVYKRIKG